MSDIKHLYIVCISSDYVHDTQVRYPSEDDQDADFDPDCDGDWHDADDLPLFLGTITAPSIEEASKKASSMYRYPEEILSIIMV